MDSPVQPGEMEQVIAEIGRLGTAHRVYALAAGLRSILA